MFLISYIFREQIFHLLKKPLEEPLAKYNSQNYSENLPLSISDISKFNCQCTKISSQVEKNSFPLQLQCFCKEHLASSFLQTKNEEMNKLIFISLPEVFFAYLKLAFFLGLFFSFPYLIIEIWRFLTPALYKNEKKLFWFFIPATFIAFLGGAFFGYFFVFPYGFDFFLSLSKPTEISASLSVGNYVSFALKLLFAFGLVFETPMIILFLSRLGLVTPQLLLENTKYAIIISFVFGAILTPPDPFTMFLMAFPLIILYLFSILLCFITYNRKKAELKKLGFKDTKY